MIIKIDSCCLAEGLECCKRICACRCVHKAWYVSVEKGPGPEQEIMLMPMREDWDLWKVRRFPTCACMY